MLLDERTNTFQKIIMGYIENILRTGSKRLCMLEILLCMVSVFIIGRIDISRFYFRKKYSKVIDNKSPFAIVYAIYKLQPTRSLTESFLSELISLFEKHSYADVQYYGFIPSWKDIMLQEASK